MSQNRSAPNHLLRTVRLALHRSMIAQLAVLACFWMAGEGVGSQEFLMSID